jgi:Helix-turn-helix domain
MGQVLHGSARTTEAVRRAIQLRQESVRALAKRYGVSPTTVQKWRKRETTTDAPMGPKEPRSTVLTPEEEAIIVAFRRHTLLPLDDCLYGLQPVPDLIRDPAPHPLEPAPLPGTTRHQPAARDRGRQASEEALRPLRHRLLPHRHRRGANRRG